MKLLLDSYVFEEVKRDKVLSENLEDLRNTLKEASIELDSRPLSKADLKKLADLFDFIITENRDIHKISNELGISDKILLLDEALQIFKVYLTRDRIIIPPALKSEPVSNLDYSDPIFDSLKEEYNPCLLYTSDAADE